MILFSLITFIIPVDVESILNLIVLILARTLIPYAIDAMTAHLCVRKRASSMW